MKNSKIPALLLGVLIGATLTSATAVGAVNYLKANIYNVKIVVNNKEAKLTDQPLNVNGKTYLPLRDTANALGYGVSSVTSSKIELKSDGSVPIASGTKTTDSTGPSTTNNAKGEYVKDLETKFSSEGKIDANKIKLAIASGEISINAQDEETGNSLLHYAVLQDNYSLYQVIHVNALNPNLQNKEGQTPLHLTVIEKNRFYLGELKDLKVNANILDKASKKAIDYASDSSIKAGLQAYML